MNQTKEEATINQNYSRVPWIIAFILIPLITLIGVQLVMCRCSVGTAKGLGVLFIGIIAWIRASIGIVRKETTRTALIYLALPVVMIILVKILFVH